MHAPLPSEGGCYALVLRNSRPRKVSVGALGRVSIEPGYLVYVGSAFGPGGIRARVGRHLRTTKPLHWHIDYLRRYLAIKEVWLTTAPESLEHAWAQRLVRDLEPAFPRFGASDCRCGSHLFFSTGRPSAILLGEPGISAARVETWRP
ncbi:MAG: DUF123 domain-containing protein [Gammaproteobacteria bacterium]